MFFGGVPAHAFVLALKAEKEECLPPSCPATRVTKKRGGADFVSANMFPSAWYWLFGSWAFDNRRSQMPPTLLPRITHNGFACILKPLNAKLSAVLFRGTLLKSATVTWPCVLPDNRV